MVNKKFQYAFIGIVALSFLAWLIIAFLNQGKVQVTIDAVPQDATILLNGKKISTGIQYLTPGTYTVTGEAPGYAKSSETFVVESKPITVGVLPEPQSADVINALAKDTALSAKREALGGANANRIGENFENKNPLTKKLPYVDPESIFSIDYGVNPDNRSQAFYLIRNSSTQGRKEAIAWIRSQGFSVAELDIRYDDFINPLVDRARAERGE